MAHVKIDIPLPKTANIDREAIADAIIETIVERTQQKSINKDGRKFPGYSKAYRESLDFELAGKTEKVNLTMTGDMLAALEPLAIKSNKLTIGFDPESEENDKAEGNITGSYGGDPQPKRARNFMGLPAKALAKIIAEYSDLTQYKAYEFVKANYDNTQSERI